MPPPVQLLLAATVDHREWRHWAAFDDDELVGTALSFMELKVAWIGWMATRESHRGRGVQSALLYAALQEAVESGCNYITAETASGKADSPDPSNRNFLRFGFIEAYERPTYISTR